MKFRVDIPTQHEETGAPGWQCLVVDATASREAKSLALQEATDLPATRHRQGAVLVTDDPQRPISVHDLSHRLV
ncbi:hypothetical protein ACFY2W_36115 [Streptomyces sp. NPDC001262]|uniref:hypothetical protein n=1 Tax=Streptomyces sp. NPDC001262 TaxID=3364552 RepID=UPI003673A2D1